MLWSMDQRGEGALATASHGPTTLVHMGQGHLYRQ